jgi:hypothetical protein
MERLKGSGRKKLLKGVRNMPRAQPLAGTERKLTCGKLFKGARKTDIFSAQKIYCATYIAPNYKAHRPHVSIVLSPPPACCRKNF